jgi:hypothetical protein
MQIRMRTLRVLEAYSPNSAPTAALLDAVNVDLPRKLSTEQLAVELVWLHGNTLVDKIADPLDPDATRWVITRVGLGALRQ